MLSTVVAIPTYRRPDGLRRLLTAISLIDYPLRIIVADNDPELLQGAAVAEAFLASGSCAHPIVVLRVPDRGIAQARNALVAQAISFQETRDIAMIDDDEYPKAGWLDGLLKTRGMTRAHVVGGPVCRIFETAVPSYVAKANNYDVGSRSTGPVDFVDATSNILFDADLFRENDGPWFDGFYGLTGGEDKDFLLSLRLRSKTFAWCDEARVCEVFPISRCSRRWALQRAFRVGNSDMLINLRRRPPEFSIVGEALKICVAASVAVVNMTILSIRPSNRFEGQRLAARTAGKLSAVFGYKHLEYTKTHGD